MFLFFENQDSNRPYALFNLDQTTDLVSFISTDE
jgi:hypothetical protein